MSNFEWEYWPSFCVIFHRKQPPTYSRRLSQYIFIMKIELENSICQNQRDMSFKMVFCSEINTMKIMWSNITVKLSSVLRLFFRGFWFWSKATCTVYVNTWIYYLFYMIKLSVHASSCIISTSVFHPQKYLKKWLNKFRCALCQRTLSLLSGKSCNLLLWS